MNNLLNWGNMSNYIFNYIIPFTTFLGIPFGIFANIKKLPHQKLSKISTECNLLKEIKNALNTNKKEIALIVFRQILNFKISQKEIEFIFIPQNFTYYYENLKSARKHLTFDENNKYHYMQKHKRKITFSIIYYFLTVVPSIVLINLLPQIFIKFKEKQLTGIVIFILFLLLLSIISIFHLRRILIAYDIHKEKRKTNE